MSQGIQHPTIPMTPIIMPNIYPWAKIILETLGCQVIHGARVVIIFPEGTTKRQHGPTVSCERYTIMLPGGVHLEEAFDRHLQYSLLSVPK